MKLKKENKIAKLINSTVVVSTLFLTATTLSAAEMKLRLSATASATDIRALALENIFSQEIMDVAQFEGHWNSSLFKQGTELEAIARNNLDMAITSAQELSEFIPEFSIFSAGYVHRDAEHQKRVFNAEFMKPLKEKAEEQLGVKLLSVMYLGKRHVNLRTENKITTPSDLEGIKLRMPGNTSWLFLGKALGANPTPLAFSEVYTALKTGAIDGQDNPLPTNKDAKFYEVTKQIVLTGHLVDLNYIAISSRLWNSLPKNDQDKIQSAADKAADWGRERQLKSERELVDFFKSNGLSVYEPDLDSFRMKVQSAYLNSGFSKLWIPGMLDKINEL